jgi:hypothetical protein
MERKGHIILKPASRVKLDFLTTVDQGGIMGTVRKVGWGKRSEVAPTFLATDGGTAM